MHCNLILENTQINEELTKELEKIFTEMNVEFVAVYSSYYILKLINKEDWNILLEKIGENSKNFVLTPILEVGFYNGLIQDELWDKINKLTGYGEAGEPDDIEEY